MPSKRCITLSVTIDGFVKGEKIDFSVIPAERPVSSIFNLFWTPVFTGVTTAYVTVNIRCLNTTSDLEIKQDVR
ncbi:MAG: hypothetical protein SWQ30_16115 [Thermodesulfobacteriota bacterium]|nr:hypothetical protein [Thermodesulfobacteriota bacterium]